MRPSTLPLGAELIGELVGQRELLVEAIDRASEFIADRQVEIAQLDRAIVRARGRLP